MDAFLLLAIMNAACIPLVIMTIKKKGAAKPVSKVVISDH
jgi:DHA2 family multidrug resistance protein